MMHVILNKIQRLQFAHHYPFTALKLCVLLYYIAACQQAASMHFRREQRTNTPEYSFDVIRVFIQLLQLFILSAVQFFISASRLSGLI